MREGAVHRLHAAPSRTPRKPVIQRADGYRLAWAPDHPDAHKGYVYEHRLVAELKIGRPLRRDEHVHHINEDPSDNRPENLEVLTVSQHRRLHGSTDLTDEQIAELMRAGYTGERLKEEFGVHTHRATKVRKAAGLEMRVVDRAQVLELLRSGMLAKDVAELMGCSRSLISLIKNGKTASCRYCGKATSGRGRSCEAHEDLPELDRGVFRDFCSALREGGRQ